MHEQEILDSATTGEIEKTIERLWNGDSVDIIYWRWFKFFKDNRTHAFPEHVTMIMAGEIKSTRALTRL